MPQAAPLEEATSPIHSSSRAVASPQETQNDKRTEEMQIVLNQQTLDAPTGLRLGQLLEEQGFASPYVAVALNRRVVARNEWEATELCEGDRIMVIGAVKGG